MPIQDRYLHSLVVKKLAPVLDSRGQPVRDEFSQATSAPSTVATVAGLLQPRTAREVAQANQAGAVIGEHVAYMDPLPTLDTDCWIELAGVRYDVVTIADAAGLGHHYEVGLRRVS